jgi:hypothetical protein
MTNKKRIQRTNQELRTITNRLFYEWQMLAISAEVIQTGIEQLIENALIESGAIHSRALTKFFYPFEGKRPPLLTDAIADDFFVTSDEWKTSCPKMPNELNYDTFGKYADKQIAHIIYSDEGKHQWNFTLIANALQPILEKFVELVKPEQLGDRWSSQLKHQTGSRWETLKKLVTAKNS